MVQEQEKKIKCSCKYMYTLLVVGSTHIHPKTNIITDK